MELLLPLLLGFVIASIGIMPPGLINMTAAKVSLKDGRNEAISFAIGATVIVFIQTYIAILFAKFIYSRQDIIDMLQEIGLVLFIGLTFYCLGALTLNRFYDQNFEPLEKSKSANLILRIDEFQLKEQWSKGIAQKDIAHIM